MGFEKEEFLIKNIKGGRGVKKMSTPDIINYLKTNNIDLNTTDIHGYNLLHYAIKAENADVVNLFLKLSDYKPKNNLEEEDNLDLKEENQPKEQEEFLSEPADANTPTNDDKNSIYLSPTLLTLVSCNDSQICSRIIKYLIKYGADIESKDDDGCSLFMRCAEKGKLDIIDYISNLNNWGAVNINEKCNYGSALHMAIIGEQEDIISYLLDNNIDITIKDSNGNSALHLALELKLHNIFKVMQDFIIASETIRNEIKKEIFNMQNEEGNTILHILAYAKSNFFIEMIKKYPSECSVDLELKNKEGYTYKGVQENIVKLAKAKEEKDKLYRETVRLEKEKAAMERKLEKERQKEEIIRLQEAEDRQREFGEKLIKYRGILFVVIAILFLIVMFAFVNTAVYNKKKPKVL